jgi:hypothetical protein
MATDTQDLTAQIAERMRNSHFGKYRGLVTNVDDPLKIGRVTAKVRNFWRGPGRSLGPARSAVCRQPAWTRAASGS